MMKKILVPVILLFALLLSSCGFESALESRQSGTTITGDTVSMDENANTNETIAETISNTEAASDKGTLAPFKSIDLEGNEVSESIFAEADITLVNIWATFCGPCLGEMPSLGELAAEYADKGVRVIGIVVDVPQVSDGSFDQTMIAKAQELVGETGADYLHIFPGEDLVNKKLKDVMYVPETFFVDSEGNIISDSYVGAKSKEEWAAIIEKMISEVKQ